MGDTKSDFWWSIELEASPAEEDALMSVADLSGSIGSELFEEEGRLVLRAAYRSSEPVEYWLDKLRALLADCGQMEIRSHSKIENRPWHTDHLDAFPPLLIGNTLVVMAPWHKGKEPEGKIPIYIYPSSAFGTGYHESTQIAMTLLEKFMKSGDAILDIGTGSGVLFIAGLKMGASSAAARDIDPTVIAEALRNMELNGLKPSLCDLRVGYLTKGIEGHADVLTANILIEPNLELLQSLCDVLKPGGTAIFSGMSLSERSRFVDALNDAQLLILAELTKNDWWGCAVKFGS